MKGIYFNVMLSVLVFEGKKQLQFEMQIKHFSLPCQVVYVITRWGWILFPKIFSIKNNTVSENNFGKNAKNHYR